MFLASLFSLVGQCNTQAGQVLLMLLVTPPAVLLRVKCCMEQGMVLMPLLL
uniref:Uncharacterized protein n=1 Tax=Arundo donax TaxID=35708 RepID=A0A0A8XU38_ARUDO